MAQRKYSVVVPKRIMEGLDNGGNFTFEVFAKDTKQAIRRARALAVASGEFQESTITDDWRWKRLQVK